MEKLAFLSPLIHSIIMAKSDFFAADRMDVHQQFYMLPSSRRDARSVLDRKLSESSSADSHQGPGSRSSAGDSAAQRQPTLAMETDPVSVPDLRDLIKGNHNDPSISFLQPDLRGKLLSSGAGSSACTTQRPPSPKQPEVLYINNLQPRESQKYKIIRDSIKHDIREFMKRVPQEERERYSVVMHQDRMDRNSPSVSKKARPDLNKIWNKKKPVIRKHPPSSCQGSSG
jgi:hypothetical protein